MKRSFCFALGSVSLLVSLLVFVTGCNDGHGHSHDDGHTHAPAAAASAGGVHDVHAALHAPKHGEVVVEFPGHKYAMEVIDDEATGQVTAFLTDAHFEPVAIDTNTQSVNIHFTVAGTPTTYTLQRSDVVISLMAFGQVATFTVTDAVLAKLICEGWEGTAMAVVEIGGVPYQAPLVKLGQHDHAH